MAPTIRKKAKRKIIIPTIVSIISILIITLFLIIKYETNQINAIKNSEIIELYQGDTFESVSNNLKFKDKIHHFKITWDSKKPDTVNLLGKITPQPQDETVEITAIIQGVFVRRKILIKIKIKGYETVEKIKVTYPSGIIGYIDGKPIDMDETFPPGTEVDFTVETEEGKQVVVFVNGISVKIKNDNTFTHVLEENITIVTYYINEENILIVYDANGGKLDNQGLIYEIVNINSILEDSYIPTKEGYIFKHWSVDKVNPYNFNTKITHHLFLYAVYDPIIEETFKITFAEPISVMKNQDLLVSGDKIGPDDKLEILIPYNQLLYEIKFKVNDTDVVLDTTIPNLGMYQIDNPNSNLDLRVELIPKKVKVAFDLQEGTTTNLELLNQEINAGNKLIEIININKEHYIFKYWTLDLATKIEFNLSIPVYENITLYAVYEPITYNLNINNSQEFISYKVNDEVTSSTKLVYEDKLTLELNLDNNQKLIYVKVLIDGLEIILTETDFIDNKYELIVAGNITIISEVEIIN